MRFTWWVSHVAIVCQWPMLQIQEGFTSTQSTCVRTDETLFLCPCLCCCCFLTLCFYHKTEGSQDLFVHSSELAVSPISYVGCLEEVGGRAAHTWGEADCTTPGQRCHGFSWPDYMQQERKWLYVPNWGVQTLLKEIVIGRLDTPE